MRLARIATVLALAIATTTFAASAGAVTNGNPTAAQIKKAIAQAEHSKLLWATVNICNSKRDPDTIGIRGQMPSLGFPAWLSMNIQLNYYSAAANQFIPLPSGGIRTTRLGRSSVKLEQGGATWSFNKPVLLNASIEFVWRRAGKLLGEITQMTTAGHPTEQFGSPAHYSAKQCRIP